MKTIFTSVKSSLMKRLGRPIKRWMLTAFAVGLLSAGLLNTGLGSLSLAERVPQKLTPVYSFLAVGDTGSGTSKQALIAGRLALTAKPFAQKPFPLLMLGDVVYPVGDFKQLGKQRVTEMYAAVEKEGAVLKPAMGNHDELLQRGKPFLNFFALPKAYYQFSFGPVAFFCLDTNQSHLDKLQLAWLDKALTTTKAPWRLVYGHHPLYTSGEHQQDAELAVLRKKLEPILLKHKVDLYLAGHDHNYERFELQNNHLLKMVSGGGGASLRTIQKKRAPGSLKALSLHHYLKLEATETTLAVEAIDGEGKGFDSVQLVKPVPL